jgi:CMP/dCMP kinase
MNNVTIAIDGPAGAGKSTIARKLSMMLGLRYLDTGAIYRTVGLHMMQQGIDLKDSKTIKEALEQADISIRFDGDIQHMILNGQDVSAAIRTMEASHAASMVALDRVVRTFATDMARRLAHQTSLVIDGRDIGTNVLPDASYKFFVTATPEERAKRRQKELLQKGQDIPFSDILKDINFRDYNDSNREVAPLKIAEDAIVIDTTKLDIDQVLQRLKKYIT